MSYLTATSIVFICKFNENQFPVSVIRGTKFDDVMTSIKSRLNQIEGFNQHMNVDAFSIKFSVGSVSNVSIVNDDDLECSFNLASQFNTGVLSVEIHIIEEELEDVSDEDDLAGLSDEDPYQLTDDEAIHCDNNPDEDISGDYLDKFSKHGDKFLRSDLWKNAITGVGQVFETGRTQFRRELSKWAIAAGFQYVYKKNDLERISVECKYKNEGCKWFVHARLDKMHDYFSIRKLNKEHTCNHVFRKLKEYRMGSNIIADEIKDYFDHNTTVSPKDVKEDFLNKYGLNVSYSHAWRGVERAKEQHYGQVTSTYDQLRTLKTDTEEANKDSVVHLEYDEQTKRFQRLFIAYGPCIEGFNFCRPLLFFYGTFLKSRYKGQLLAATGKDANKGLYPLAIAVVDSETIDNWTWFMECLSNVLKADRTITFISDRNKGLLEAVSKVFPDSPHGFCLLHLRANLKDRLGGMSREVKSRIIQLLQQAAQTPSQEQCDSHISEMKIAGKDAVVKFLRHAPLENWANSYFVGKRYGELYSNIAESFNKWIRSERNLPVKSMIDDIRRKIMSRMAKRRKLALEVTTVICPQYVEWYERAKEKGMSWVILEANDHVYEVMSNPSVVVDLLERNCTCRKWQIRCFPCSHAIAAILNCGKNVFDYIEEYFLASYWHCAHARTIYPTPIMRHEEVQPEDIVVMPPLTKVPPGRPKKSRFPSRSERYRARRPIKCSRCGIQGHHNKKTCTASIDM